MVTANFTRGAKRQLFELYCTDDITGGIQYQLKCLLAINIVLSITATLGNTLIQDALRYESSIHPPSRVFLRCLATTDLCVGLIAAPLAVIHWISAIKKSWSICLYAKITSFVAGYLLCAVSLLTLTAISVDRLLALLLYLRYKHVVTLKKTYVVVVAIWILSTINATMSLWNNLAVATSWYGYIGITLCLLTSTFCYTKIFLSLRNHCVEARVFQEQTRKTNLLNIARYKKTVYSTMWLQLTLVACYLPYGVTEALLTQRELSSSVYISSQIACTLVYLNSSLNPILYCWKLPEVRQAVKARIRQLCCSSR